MSSRAQAGVTGRPPGGSPPRSAHENASGFRWLAILVVGVCAVVAAVHWPVLHAQATTFDDAPYLIENPLVQNPSWDSTRRFLTEVLKPSTVSGYYQPIAMISLMLDWAAGARPEHLEPLHRTSLAIHVLNTGLVVVFFYLLFGQPWVAALVGLLFGVHPITVESIAWLSERKTLLAMLFFMTALVFYAAYVRFGRKWPYPLSIAAFALAVLSKPTSTPLPVLLVLLDFWPLRRVSWRTLLEKVPFFVVALAAALVTYISQSRAAFVESPEEKGLGRILLFLCHNIVFYLQHFLWPVQLTSFYPFPEPMSMSHPALLAGVLGTAGLLVLLLVSLRWTRAAATGWLFFFFAVLPTMGIVGFTNVIASMRYVYLPALGFLLVVAAALLWLGRHRGARGVSAVCVLLLAGLASVRTREQIGYWQESEKLYRHMLCFAPEAAPLHNDLGTLLSKQKRYDEALTHLFKAVAAGGPVTPMAHSNLGLALDGAGRPAEALEHYRTAVRLWPDFAAGRLALGRALLATGQFAEAAEQLRESLRLRPAVPVVYHPLGQALARLGKLDEARPYLEQALQADPNSAEIQSDLGNVLAMRDDWRGAAEHYQAALRLNPNLPDVQANLGTAWRQLEELDQAVAAFREALRQKPSSPYIYAQLGQILTAQGKLAEALEVFEAGLRLAPQDVELRTGLEEARLR